MYRIVIFINGIMRDLACDMDLSFEEACNRADMYKDFEEKAIFYVVSNDDNEVRYVV